MDRTERFYRIDQLLNDRKVVPFSTLVEKLEVSRATIKRDLEYMRNRLNAPIVWDHDEGGYRFAGREAAPRSTSCPACGSRRRRCMRC
ncbi:MAG: HTH domain-containing protein [Rhodocyclaceae bacterium]|nr:HTH domain-containing protein [Rhodocyclaceae bacterium]